MRGWALAGQVTSSRAHHALSDLAALTVTYSPMAHLVETAWALRGRVTAYDAMYVALAQALDCPLVTLDARLAHAVGQEVQVIVPGE